MGEQVSKGWVGFATRADGSHRVRRFYGSDVVALVVALVAPVVVVALIVVAATGVAWLTDDDAASAPASMAPARVEPR